MAFSGKLHTGQQIDMKIIAVQCQELTQFLNRCDCLRLLWNIADELSGDFVRFEGFRIITLLD